MMHNLATRIASGRLWAIAAVALSCGMVSTAQAGQVRFSGEGHAETPSWSLDGKHLAFEVNRLASDVKMFIAEVNGDVAKDGVLVSLPGGASAFGGSGQVVVNATWHPQGIAVFEGSNQGGQYRLYFGRPTGGGANEMVTNSEIKGDLTFPTISSDGGYMGFVADATGAGDIRIRNSQTGELRQLTSTPDSEMFPQFNADGSKILFTKKQNGSEDVFEVDVTSEAVSSLAGGSGDQTRPVYAANGSVVFFDGGRGDGHWDLMVMAGGSSNAKTLARDVRLPTRARPAISPDGKWVAYGFSDPSKDGLIVMQEVDGSRKVEIPTGLKAAGDPAIGQQGSRTLLAFTALPSSGSDWRFLTVKDVTDKL